jgi:Flp pilus assembly protein TadG
MRARRGAGGAMGRGGVAALEFAIVAGVMSMMLMGVYDYGMVAWHKLQVHNAVRAGAAYAAYHGYDQAKIMTVVTTASDYPAITASPAPSEVCGCAEPSGAFVESACGGSCADGGTKGKYARVSARADYHFVLPFPGRSGPVVMSTHGIARLE